MSSIEIEGVQARYGDTPVLKDFALSAQKPDVVLLIGRNGCGKSTALKTTAGQMRPSAGRILLNGNDVTQMSRMERVKAGIGFVPQAGSGGRAVFPHLSVLDNLIVVADVHQLAIRQSEIDRVWGLFPELKQDRKRPAGFLSGGQQQMLAIALAMLVHPHILLLDEPTCGLVRGKALEILSFVKKLATAEGIVVLIVEQNISITLDYVDRVVAMRSGTIVDEVAPERARDINWIANVL